MIPRSEQLPGIARDLRRWRDVGNNVTIRPSEPQLAIRVAIDLVALLVNAAMVTATQHDQIGERGGPAVSPVVNVVALNKAQSTSREAATMVTMLERPTNGRRNRAGPGPDLHHAAVGVMAHHHPARIARQALGRFRGN